MMRIGLADVLEKCHGMGAEKGIDFTDLMVKATKWTFKQ